MRAAAAGPAQPELHGFAVDADDFERAIRVIYGAFVDSDDNIITVEEAEEEATNE